MQLTVLAKSFHVMSNWILRGVSSVAQWIKCNTMSAFYIKNGLLSFIPNFRFRRGGETLCEA